MHDALERLFDHFERAGYALYLVGGAVRDALLGAVPTDMDLATDAKPEAMQALPGEAASDPRPRSAPCPGCVGA